MRVFISDTEIFFHVKKNHINIEMFPNIHFQIALFIACNSSKSTFSQIGQLLSKSNRLSPIFKISHDVGR